LVVCCDPVPVAVCVPAPVPLGVVALGNSKSSVCRQGSRGG
jgi:hypothetical protein